MKKISPEQLERQGKWNEAIKLYEMHLRRNPNDEYAIKKLGDLYERVGRREDAIRIFSKLGNYYLKNQFYKKAIAIYKKIYQMDPSNINYGMKLAELYSLIGLKVNAKNLYLHLAELLSKQKRMKDSIEVYKKLASLYPEDLQTKEMLVNLYLNEGIKDEGVSLLIEIAREFYSKGNIEEAISRVKRALTLQPDNLEALKFAKRLSEVAGTDIFEKFAREALKRSTNREVKNLLLDYYISIQEIEKAKQLIEELLIRDPESEELKRKLADIYLFTGDFDRAFSIISSLAEKKVEEGEDEVALELLNSLLKVKPTHEQTLEKVAEIYENAGKKNSLIAVLSTLAEIYEQKGEEEKLTNTVKKLLTLDPDNVAFQEWYARLIGEEFETEEEFVNTHMEEAENYMKLELWVKAEAELEKILSKYPDHWQARLKLLEVYLRKGDKKATKRLADELRMEALNNPEKLEQLENLLSSFVKEEEAIEKEKAEDSDEMMELEEEILEEEEELLSSEGSETMFDFSLAQKELLDEQEEEIEIEEEDFEKGSEEVKMETSDISLEEASSVSNTELVEQEGVQIPTVEEELLQETVPPTRDEFNPEELIQEAGGEKVDLTTFGTEFEQLLEKEEKAEEVPSEKAEEKIEGEVFDLGKVIAQELEAMEEVEAEDEDERKKEKLEKEMIKKFSSSMSASVAEEDYQTHFDLGIAYMEMGMYDDAIAEFQISSKAKEKRLESLELMGICLLEKGLYEEAIETLERGLKEEGHSPEKYLGLKYNLARVYAELGNRERAKELISEINSVDPEYLAKVKAPEELLQ